MSDAADFKNFHRSLCARFGYTHDEVHWRRDLVSLEEHIAKKIRASSAPANHRAPTDEYLQLLSEGKTLDEIGKQYGITKMSVRNALARKGLPTCARDYLVHMATRKAEATK